MFFKSYSNIYASQIAVFAGMISLSLRALGIEIVDSEIEFAIGVTLNFGGMIWALVERYRKGDITVGGVRK